MGGSSSMSMAGNSSSMGHATASAAKRACKISMLWNWYTIDTCFIARSWKNDTKGKFAGSCIGCFMLVVIAQWLNRISRQLDIELVKRHSLQKWAQQVVKLNPSGEITEDGESVELPMEKVTSLANESEWRTLLVALGNTFSHKWYFNFTRVGQLGMNEVEDCLLYTSRCV